MSVTEEGTGVATVEINYRDTNGKLLWDQTIAVVANGWRVPVYEEYLIRRGDLFRVKHVIWHDGSKYHQRVTVVLVSPAEEDKIRKALGWT